MDKIDYTSDVWTGEQALLFRQTVNPPLALMSVITSAIALIAFYSFPRLRKFPASILSWIAYHNLLFCSYVVFKWAKWSVLSEDWGTAVAPGSWECKAGLFIDNFTMTGLCACNTLLALTVFLATKFLIRVDEDRRYYWGYLAFAWIYPGGIGLYTALGFDTYREHGKSCSANSEVAQIFLRAPYFFFLLLQIILYTYSVVRMRRTVGSVNGTTRNFDKKAVTYLTIRFIAMWTSEAFNCLPAQIVKTLWKHPNIARWERLMFVSHSGGGFVDAMVLILGNNEFMAWLKQNIWSCNFRFRLWMRHNDIKSTDSPRLMELSSVKSDESPMESLDDTSPNDSKVEIDPARPINSDPTQSIS